MGSCVIAKTAEKSHLFCWGQKELNSFERTFGLMTGESEMQEIPLGKQLGRALCLYFYGN